MNPRISMITLGVAGLETSVRFYKKGPGFPKMDSPPEVAFFTLNGSWLGVYGREPLAEDAGMSPMGSGFSGFTLSHNVASEADVDKIVEKAVSAGAILSKPPKEASWGGVSRLFQRSGRLPVGDRLQPTLLGWSR